jgi:pimeloyl-ACP methyl ester carboxylesterase
MSAGREGAFVRRGGIERGPALWCVPALGDCNESFAPLFATELAGRFKLCAPDLFAGSKTPEARAFDLDGFAERLAGTIGQPAEDAPLGLVGHSLGAAIAVRAVGHLGARVVGLFSIEGNLTEEDAYFSGLATSFDDPELFKQELLTRVAELARRAADHGPSLARYHACLRGASAQALWCLGRSAKAASCNGALGAEYRALPVPSLYYWSPRNTPAATQAYVRKHGVRHAAFEGGHWPMMEQPDETARQIARFFEPLFAVER